MIRTVAILAGIAIAAAPLLAGGPQCTSKKGAKANAGKSCCSTAKTVAASNMPSMRAVVGDKEFYCPMEATKHAAATGQKASYFLEGKEFDSPAELGKAYAARLDEYLTEITTVKYSVGEKYVGCPMTAKSMAKKAGKPVQYQLASQKFESKKNASEAADAARAAADGVEMTAVVGDQTFHCATKAGKVAADTGKPAHYTVGDKTVDCPIQASVMLKMAKVQAALATMGQTKAG